jgi:hypothetical protein
VKKVWTKQGPTLVLDAGTVRALSLSNDGKLLLLNKNYLECEGNGSWTVLHGSFPRRSESYRSYRAILSGNGTTAVRNAYYSEDLQVYEYITGWSRKGQGLGDFPYRNTDYCISDHGRVLAYVKGPHIDFEEKVLVYKYDETITEWVQVGQSIDSNATSMEQITSIALSDNGKILATASHFQNFQDWNLRNAQFHVYAYDAEGDIWLQLGQRLEGTKGQFKPQRIFNSSIRNRIILLAKVLLSV